jgi:3-isopropylmalate/(R)-2-methylmalate dehydratase small subunit
MEPLKKISGVVAPLNRPNVDTDQIIPKQFLKRVERTGFGEFAFFDWRYLPDGSPNPDFELNDPKYEHAEILVTGRNFGCGSSREHAPWPLREIGFRVLIASSFADIFNNNCIQNGMLPIALPEEQVQEIIRRAQRKPGYRLTVTSMRSPCTTPNGSRRLSRSTPSCASGCWKGSTRSGRRCRSATRSRTSRSTAPAI